FSYYEDADDAGHKYGFGTPPYLSRLAQLDDFIAKLLTVIRLRSQVYPETWLVLVTTDHGGGGLFPDDHGEDSPICRNIFLAGSIFPKAKGFFDSATKPHYITDVYHYALAFLTNQPHKPGHPDTASYADYKWFQALERTIHPPRAHPQLNDEKAMMATMNLGD